jgi:hypothetical protein
VTARWYAAAILLAAAAGVFVLWQVATSASTDCFLNSVELSPGGKLSGCSEDIAKAVEEAVKRPGQDTERSTEVEARSAFAVWLALFAATAGFAAIVGVRSVAIIAGLRPVWDSRLIALSAGAVVLAALPFALFRVLANFGSARLGHFDELHEAEFLRLDPLIGALAILALIGLVVVGHVVSTRSRLGLEGLAALGSDLRRLVGMLGAFLALAVLTTAARWEAIGTLPGDEAVPGAVVLLWGGAFALALAAVYVPVYQLWATATGREIAEEVERQLSAARALSGTQGFRAPELALSKELTGTLGLGGAGHSLQGSVAVLAPVIAAAVSSLFA